MDLEPIGRKVSEAITNPIIITVKSRIRGNIFILRPFSTLITKQV
jgi:hypothetical protein